MDSQEWAHIALQQKHNQNSNQRHGIEILRALLSGISTPEQAAKDMTSTYAPGVRRETGQPGYAYAFWELFCHAVRHVGSSVEQSERLAGLLQSISDQPDLLDDGGCPVTAPEGKR